MKIKVQAFSLIELIVVIAIVSVLSAIAVPSYRDYMERGKVLGITSIVDKALIDWEHAYELGQAFPGATGPLGSYIHTVTYDSQGVSVTLNNPSNIDSSLDGTTITYTPSLVNNVINWNCTASNQTPGYTTTQKTTVHKIFSGYTAYSKTSIPYSRYPSYYTVHTQSNRNVHPPTNTTNPKAEQLICNSVG